MRPKRMAHLADRVRTREREIERAERDEVFIRLGSGARPDEFVNAVTR
jgi:hypothetical protein